MFLQLTKQYNPSLIDYALHLVSSAHIEPDTYVIDMDAIKYNALTLLESASAYGVNLYCMLKQLGRNPKIARHILNSKTADDVSFRGVVAVDFRDAIQLYEAGIPVKHVGHLVQIPEHSISTVLKMEPDVITVYSVEKAKQISSAMKKNNYVSGGRVQNILLRITDSNDLVYPGQEGGVLPKDVPSVVEQINFMEGIRFIGLTAFPCFLYDNKQGNAQATANAFTLAKTVNMLKNEHGIICSHINMPSCNSPATIKLISKMGGTHAEPGHSLTGTNPDNLTAQVPLVPALVYATEVSHHYKGNSLCFGGGYYRRSSVSDALVKTSLGIEKTTVKSLDAEAIDYHFELDKSFAVGSPVVMAFRTQIFVTRSRVALVSGLGEGNPKLDSIWDSQGNCITDMQKIGKGL